jgi:hypothetical protein
LLLLVGACGLGLGKDAHGLPTGLVSEKDILGRPEASLYYPGSKVVESHGEGELSSPLEGNRPAYVQTYLIAAEADRQGIEDWYGKKLTALGWHRDGNHEPSVWFARDSRESFTLRFSTVAPPDIPWDGNGTLFSIDYQIAPCSQQGVTC